LLINEQYQMHVIGHHCVAAEVDGKDIGQLKQLVLNPLASVLEISSGQWIFATEPGAPDTARDTMVIGSGFERDEGLPRLGHDIAP
jgi:hypothetical protein